MRKKTIGILTGGGDCPGLNAVIRAAVRTARSEHDLEVVGIQLGFEGLLTRSVVPLTTESIRGILPKGGTLLRTTNRGNPFAFPSLQEGHPVVVDRSAEVIRNIHELGIDGIIAIGGDGTLRIAQRLCDMGIPMVAVPKTIDNDLAATDYTFGFFTAVSVATEAVDRLHTTAESHDRVMILEVMGRHAGWIALHSGVSGGADVILIPEIPFSMEEVARKVRERDSCDAQFSIIVAAEGAREIEGSQHYQASGDQMGAARLGGVGQHVAQELMQLTGKEARCVVLGHLQRGGSPNAFDRMLATNFGSAAVRALMRGERAVMVSLQAANIRTVPLAEATAALKTVPPDSQLVRTARDVGVSFGAPDEERYHHGEGCDQ